MKILITGAAGIVGQGIRPYLSSRHELVLFDRVEVPDPASNETIFVGDACDANALNAAAQGCDGMVILAATHGEHATFESTLNLNYRGLIAALDAGVAAGSTSVVFASSNHGWGLYEKSLAPIPNSAPPRPDSWYGISKIWGEAVMAYYTDVHGLITTSLRIGNTGEKVPDERRTHMWISQRDMAGIIETGLMRRERSHRAVFTTGTCREPFFDNSGLEGLGFKPQDKVEHNLSPDYDSTPDEQDRVGGSYVTANLWKGMSS